MKRYVVFRIKQFIRRVNQDSGIVLLCILVVLGMLFYTLPNKWANLLYYVIPMVIFNNTRTDIPFLKKRYEKQYYFIQVLECLVIFVIIFLILISRVKELSIHGIGFLISFILPLVVVKQRKNISGLTLEWISIHAFEWKLVFREKMILLVVIYLVLLISTYHVFTLGLMLFIVSGICTEVYSYYEPKELVSAYFEKYTVSDKLKRTSYFLHIGFAPVYLLYAVFNIEDIMFLLVFIFFIQMLGMELILRKYAFYKEDSSSIFMNPITLLTICFSILFVFPTLYNYSYLKEKAILKIKLYAKN